MATKKFKSVFDSPQVSRPHLYVVKVKLLRDEDKKFYGTDARWLCDWGAGVVHAPQDEAFITNSLKDIEKVVAYLNWLNEKDEHLKASYAYQIVDIDVLTFGDMKDYQNRQAAKGRTNS